MTEHLGSATHPEGATPLYRTIVADPPWPYPEGFADGGTNHYVAGKQRERLHRGAIVRRQLPYEAMSLADIAALPISKLADSSARLFLWATSRYLPDALACLPAWNFTYRQLIVWDKTPNFNPLAGGVAAIAGEFLIVAARGTPGMLSRWPTSIVNARKPRSEHSRKPEVFLDLVERVSPGPYLELFARRQRLGWHTWGNEALEHVEMASGV